MKCPRCGKSLVTVTERSTGLDYCTGCGGTWYADGELRLLKDKESHGDYRWVDVDLWGDREEFRAEKQERLVCPTDGETMLTVHYGDSEIHVDICPTCKGKWLDRGEYLKIVAHIEEHVDSGSVGNYVHDVAEEFVEIFLGPESAVSELRDFGKVLYLLQLRFGVQHENLAAALRAASRGVPGT